MTNEYNFDGLVGPTHNYAGLSSGNIASTSHRELPSNPRLAALQGLEKAMSLARKGIPQAILPPLERPAVRALRSFGISGRSDADVLANAQRTSPWLLAAANSASSMWTANACTVAPAADTDDGRLHITPANLSSKLHRAIEAAETTAVLRRIFADPAHFVVNDPLQGGLTMRDEGAANHTRLCAAFDRPGQHVFTYGVDADNPDAPAPRRFIARQTLQASAAVARLNGLDLHQCAFIQQHPQAIDAGVFHNDVISVGHLNVLLYHEQAFVDTAASVDMLRRAFAKQCGTELCAIEIPSAQLPLAEAVRTYLFNSQLVSLPDHGIALVVPSECMASAPVQEIIQPWVADRSNPIREIISFDLRQSMQNGGGPACLRQRIVLTDAQRNAVTARVFLDDSLYDDLVAWVNRHYRDSITAADLADPQLLSECRDALDDLTSILQLDSLYAFQQ